jgi:hypothetical protein
MLLRAAAVVAMLLAASSAVARMHAGPSQLHAGHRLQGAIAPLDGGGSFGSPAAAYSFRRLRSAYNGPAIRIRRASNNVETDINFLGFVPGLGAPVDVAAANTFCASTSCFVVTWYDQSGGGNHVTNAAAATQSAYVAVCQNGLPCARNTLGGSQGLGSAGSLASGATLTFGVVARVPVRGSVSCIWLAVGNNTLVPAVATDVVTLNNGTTAVNATATTLASHAYVGAMNGAASFVSVDGTETTGTTSGSGPGAAYFVGGTGATCENFEMIYWNNYVLTPAERTALIANQRSFWGF